MKRFGIASQRWRNPRHTRICEAPYSASHYQKRRRPLQLRRRLTIILKQQGADSRQGLLHNDSNIRVHLCLSVGKKPVVTLLNLYENTKEV
ncbi:MAG: hypothetical protein V1721_06735 [Pseudomonadota bacterium]